MSNRYQQVLSLPKNPPK